MRLAVIADDLTGTLDASAPFARAGRAVVAPLGERAGATDDRANPPESDAPPGAVGREVPCPPGAEDGDPSASDAPRYGCGSRGRESGDPQWGGQGTSRPTAGKPTHAACPVQGYRLPDGGIPAVVAVSIESRSMSPGEASQRVETTAQQLIGAGFTHWFKKMDSTLRGHWVEELTALRRALEAQAVLVCPAFPAQGRMVAGGSVQAAGRVVGDCVAEVKQRSSLRVEGLPAGNTVSDLAAGLRHRLANGCECVVADAATDDHLDALVAAARESGMDRLLCGAGGLAAAWARSVAAPHAALQPALPSPRRILVAAGSRQGATRRQVEALCAQRLPLGAALSVWLFVCPPGGEEDVEIARYAALLADEAAQYHRSACFEALVLTGGQTAMASLRRFGARALQVLGEVEPGLPFSRVVGGEADGALCVTKAGGFGDDRTLLRVIDYLSTGGTARDVEPPPAGPNAG